MLVGIRKEGKYGKSYSKIRGKTAQLEELSQTIAKHRKSSRSLAQSR
jgi:hypothetical protein